MYSNVNQSISSLLLLAFHALWRRRRLFIVPILIILPLGLAYAKFGPRTYVAKSLLLLQENARDYPLSRNEGVGRIQERFRGLIALLKSDRVMNRVVQDLAGEDVLRDRRKSAAWLKGFSQALSLDLVGNDFLELSLAGDSPDGLGKKLDIVTSHFLEALLSSQDALTATQVLLARKKAQVDEAQRKYSQFLASNPLRPAAAIQAEQAQLDRTKRDLAAGTAKLTALAAQVDVQRRQVAADRARSQPQSKSPDGQQAKDTRSDIASTPAQEVALRELEARHASLMAQVMRLEAESVDLQRRVREGAATDRRLQTLRAEVNSARESYQTYSARFVTPVGGSTPGLLGAPERIKLIDPPRDPEFPERSALKIILGAIAASLAAAFGMVFLAELFDSTIRRSNDIEAMTGVPVLARLPAA